jgi:uncharacterized protein YxjI
MRYQMRQKFFAFGDDFAIRDANGNECFYVDGKVFTIGNKLSILDRSGNEAAYIQQKLFAWGPTYEIYGPEGLFAVVKKSVFTLFHCTFSIDVPGPDDIEATGDFLDHEYTFMRGGRPIASVSKAWFALTDTYGIEIADGEDDVLLLASAVVIDLCCHTSDKD